MPYNINSPLIASISSVFNSLSVYISFQVCNAYLISFVQGILVAASGINSI